MKTVLLLLLAISNLHAATIIDLGPDMKERYTATGISENGKVVGYIGPQDSGRTFVWENGAFHEFSGLFDPSGINNSGQVSGVEYAGANYPAYYTPNVGITVVTLNQGAATAINNLGQLTGVYSVAGTGHAFFYDGTITRDLGAGFSGRAINDIGQVAGRDSAGTNSFLYSGGVTTVFNGRARGMNASGTVVGDFYTLMTLRGFIYQKNTFTPILDDYSLGSRANDINDLGDIVGWMFVSPPQQCRFCEYSKHAFLYRNGVVTDLNDETSNRDWELVEGIAVNNSGWIIGAGLHFGRDRAFLRIP